MKGFAGILAGLFLLWCGVRIVAEINFDRNCAGYLKRAADANTVELAAENLAVAVKYAEENRMTTGYTSVVYRTPDEDVGFWYKNLKASADELARVAPDASQLEQSNVLMKLRETLTDDGEGGGTQVTVPPGISIFPRNSFYLWWALLSFIGAACFVIFDPDF
jgi:hypothetical protein